MPGALPVLSGESPVRAQPGHSGYRAAALKNRKRIPLEAGELFLDHPFFYAFAKSSGRGKPVTGAPGPDGEQSSGLAAEPKVPRVLGLALIGLGLAGDEPGTRLQCSWKGQQTRLQRNGSRTGNKQKPVVAPPGGAAVRKVDLSGGIILPAQVPNGGKMGTAAVLIPVP